MISDLLRWIERQKLARRWRREFQFREEELGGNYPLNVKNMGK